MTSPKQEPKKQKIHHYFTKNTNTPIKWSNIESIFVATNVNPSIPLDSVKVAAFDFDNTIACVQGNSTYPKSPNDWKWFHPSVPLVLKRLHHSGYILVFLSNQKSLLKPDKKAELRKKCFQGRIERTFLELCKDQEIPLIVFAATEDDIYRKPRSGMWERFLKTYNITQVDYENSFYVGDAAGRCHHWIDGHKADHANTDFKFALNCNLKFYVPEQLFHSDYLQSTKEPFFLKSVPEIPEFEFNPQLYSMSTETEHYSHNSQEHQELIILSGPPGSGNL